MYDMLALYEARDVQDAISTASPSTLMYCWMMGSLVMWVKLVRLPMRMFSSPSMEMPRISSHF